jgi:hypothetical protein
MVRYPTGYFETLGVQQNYFAASLAFNSLLARILPAVGCGDVVNARLRKLWHAFQRRVQFVKLQTLHCIQHAE